MNARNREIKCMILKEYFIFNFSYLVFSVWLEACDGEGGRVEWS